MWWVAELKLDAERKGGGLLSEMAKNGERDPGGKGTIESRPAIQLKDLGITASQSSRWRIVGDRNYGDIKTAAEQLGYDNQTIRGAIWVCKRIEMLRPATL